MTTQKPRSAAGAGPKTRRAHESARAATERKRAAIQAIPRLSTVPTNEEIARAFNALKNALEQ